MATLKENMDAIKLEKDTKILPENLKAGITAFGVTGTLEGGTIEGDVSTYVKEFTSEEEMRNSASTLEDGTICKIFEKTSYETNIVDCTEPMSTIVLPVTIHAAKVNQMQGGTLEYYPTENYVTGSEYLVFETKAFSTNVTAKVYVLGSETTTITYKYDSTLSAYTTTDITEDWVIQFSTPLIAAHIGNTLPDFGRAIPVTIQKSILNYIFEYKNEEFTELREYNENVAYISNNPDEPMIVEGTNRIGIVQTSNSAYRINPTYSYDRVVFPDAIDADAFPKFEDGVYTHTNMIYERPGNMSLSKLCRIITVTVEDPSVTVSCVWDGDGVYWDNAGNAFFESMGLTYGTVTYIYTSDTGYVKQSGPEGWFFGQNNEVSMSILGEFKLPPLHIKQEEWNDAFRVMFDGTYNLHGIYSSDSSMDGYAPYGFDAEPEHILIGKSVYSNGTKTGTMPDNGYLEYTPSDVEQAIPAGYTSGGKIAAIQPTTTTGPKVFETIETMNSSTGNEEGDLAVVYKNDIKDWTVDTATNIIMFANNVTLDEAIDYETSALICATDPNNYYLIDIMFSPTGLTATPLEGGEPVVYESQDGLTYVKTSGVDKFVLDFDICFEQEMWKDPYSKFFKTGTKNFNGLFEYKNDKFALAETQLNTTSENVYKTEFYGKNGIETGTLGDTASSDYNDTAAEIYAKLSVIYDRLEPVKANNGDVYSSWKTIPVKLDGTPLLDTSDVTDMFQMFAYNSKLITIPMLNTSNVTVTRYMFDSCTNLITIAPIDTSNVTEMYDMFLGCSNLIKVPLLDTSSATDMGAMFKNCTSLQSIPQFNMSKNTDMYEMFYNCSNLISIPELNVSNVGNMNYAFYGCSNLTTIPALNTVKVFGMVNAFKNCTSLSDDSLNNILLMCVTATTSYAEGNAKTLKSIGLTSDQATRCTSLSNYEAFTAAGWTTGY